MGSGQGDTWISALTYNHLFEKFKVDPLDPPSVLGIRGVILKDDSPMILMPWYTLENSGGSIADIPIGNQGAYNVTFLDIQGNVIGTTGFDVKFDGLTHGETEAKPSSAPLSLKLPYLQGTNEVVIAHGGIEIARIHVSKNAPQINVTSPNGGELFTGGSTINVKWNSSDPDGAADEAKLAYVVSLSEDNGFTWIPLGLDLAQKEFKFDVPSNIQTDSALIRVTVTDGVNTAADQSDSVFSIHGSEQPVPPPASPTLTTLLNATNVPIGQSIQDSATLIGATADAKGLVTYTLYLGNFCNSTTVLNRDTVSVTNGAVPPSQPVSGLFIGPYSYQANYTGDSNNKSALSACEPFSVVPLSPSISTSILLDTDNTTDVTGRTVPVGTRVHDTASLHGTAVILPFETWNITYQLFDGNSNCTGSHKDETVKLIGSAVIPASSSFTFTTPANISINAMFSGTVANNPATSACETLLFKATNPPTEQPAVGGEILGIDTTSLFMASAVVNAGWTLSIAGAIAAGIVAFIVKRRSR